MALPWDSTVLMQQPWGCFFGADEWHLPHPPKILVPSPAVPWDSGNKQPTITISKKELSAGGTGRDTAHPEIWCQLLNSTRVGEPLGQRQVMAAMPVLQPLDHACGFLTRVHFGFRHDAQMLATVPSPSCLPLRQPL